MTPVRFTYADLEQFPEDNKRREAVGGELIVAPAPTPSHQRIVGRVFLEIALFLRTAPLGEVFTAPLDVIFGDEDVIEPDVVFVSTERASLTSERGVEGPPDLVVEVLSPSTRRRDLELKRKLCQREGVRAYWAVDPVAEVIHAWEGGEERLYRADDSAVTSSLPGFALPVATLFEG